jgi:hypothetical protein
MTILLHDFDQKHKFSILSKCVIPMHPHLNIEVSFVCHHFLAILLFYYTYIAKSLQNVCNRIKEQQLLQSTSIAKLTHDHTYH